MDDKYTAQVTNQYFDFDKRYWEVTIRTNDLETLNKVYEVLDKLRKG